VADDTARRLRTAIDARILNQSDGFDPGPLRRRFAYQRVLRRLSLDPHGGWVLKGGFLLETRLRFGARATKDLDLARKTADDDASAMLATALTADPDNDHFTFATVKSIALPVDERGNRAWRITIDAVLDGRTFASLLIDIVDRLDEIGDAVETIRVPSPIIGLDLGAASILAVDIAQHAAEKFHALCLTFPDGRQNTRVKDLLDIVLLVEAELLPHPRLGDRIAAVFLIRDGENPPETLPTPPALWRLDYALLASTTGATTTDLEVAFALANDLFRNNRLPA
jgi:Nucleotidyl transferase AbiEii toxin, Type IV TA system